MNYTTIILRDMARRNQAEAGERERAEAVSTTLSSDNTLFVSAWADYDRNDVVTLWEATCLSVGINPKHEAARSKEFAERVVAIGSAADDCIKKLNEVLRRYKNVAIHAKNPNSSLNTADEQRTKIELSAFRKWVDAEKDWELPGGFPGASAAATTPSPAPKTQAAPEEADNAPAKQGNAMKKAALIDALEHEWPSIEADISEATRNGLKDAAHTGKHGEWDDGKARAWAVTKGKIKQAAPVHHLAAAWPGAVRRHTLRD